MQGVLRIGIAPVAIGSLELPPEEELLELGPIAHNVFVFVPPAALRGDRVTKDATHCGPQASGGIKDHEEALGSMESTVNEFAQKRGTVPLVFRGGLHETQDALFAPRGHT